MIKKIIAITLTMLLITSCSADEEVAKVEEVIQTSNKKNEVVDEEASLTFSIRQPQTLNPLLNEDETVDSMLKLVFEPLFTLNEKLKPIPNLAKAYTISEDGLKITISLKNDISWHDGKKITINDVIYSLDTIKSNPNSIYSSVLEYIESYSSNSDKLIINYKEPYSFALYNLCFPVIPKHYYKNKTKETSENLQTLGSGMYKFDAYSIAREITLQKTTNFKGTPKIDTIKAIISDNRETDLNTFEQNITNFIPSTVDDLGKLNSDRGFKIGKVLSNNFEFLGFNLKKEPFNNIELRKAIAYLVPKDEIVSNIYLNNGVRAETIVNPSSWLFNSKIGAKDYDQELANSHLKNAKITFTEENSLKILVNEENNERIETAEIISNRLNQIGIKNKVVKKSFQEYTELIEKDEFDMFIAGINFGQAPNYKSFLMSFGTGAGGINYSNISDANMDKLVGQVYLAKSEEELINNIYELQEYCEEYLGFVGILFKDYLLLTDENLNVTMGSRYNYFSDIADWYITK